MMRRDFIKVGYYVSCTVASSDFPEKDQPSTTRGTRVNIQHGDNAVDTMNDLMCVPTTDYLPA